MQSIRDSADIIIDTGTINTNQLRSRISEIFMPSDVDGLRVSMVSFGFSNGLPRDVDLVFDCRFLPNPHWVDELRPLTGLDEPVADYVLQQEEAQHFLHDVVSMLEWQIPAFAKEGKSYLTIAIGCTGGRHRSVAIAEEIRRRSRPAQLGLSPRHHAMRVVALGGGHGTAVTLRALRAISPDVTGIVSVADDGGSTGRLRAMLNVAAVGDLRKCLGALADPDNPLAQAFEHRFNVGELDGSHGGQSLPRGPHRRHRRPRGRRSTRPREALGVTGTIVPASRRGRRPARAVTTRASPVARPRSRAPADIARHQSRPAIAAGAAAGPRGHRGGATSSSSDPGSLFTSVLAACVVPEINSGPRAQPGAQDLRGQSASRGPRNRWIHASRTTSTRCALTAWCPTDVLVDARVAVRRAALFSSHFGHRH